MLVQTGFPSTLLTRLLTVDPELLDMRHPVELAPGFDETGEIDEDMVDLTADDDDEESAATAAAIAAVAAAAALAAETARVGIAAR